MQLPLQDVALLIGLIPHPLRWPCPFPFLR